MRTYLTSAIGILLLFAVLPVGSFADGSGSQYPANATCDANGSCRASIEWRTGSYGPSGSSILRRTLFTAYLQQGETLEVGSTAVGVNAGDAWVWSPGAITDDQTANLPGINGAAGGPVFKCSTQRAANGAAATLGQITSRAQEQAGARSADGTGNTAGYIPCTYTAPSSGLYKVAFFGPAGPNSAGTGTPGGEINMPTANYFDASQGSNISAWDITVRGANPSSTTDITGRVFTYVLAGFTGGNSRPVNFPFYATTLDGFVYRAETNGLDPNAFLIYGNERGYLDPDGLPLYHDVVGNNSSVTVTDGGTAFAPPQYPISLAPLAQETLAALNIKAPVAPTLTNLSFTGANGNKSYVGKGGTFAFDTNEHGTYEIVISRDGTDFDPGTLGNRVLRGVVDGGHRTVTWDGKDNAGATIPVGTKYQVRARMQAGVYHFPLVDAENSLKGGPSFRLTNPPGGTCAYDGSCTTAFYDDRGYHTSKGDVGTPGGNICPAGKVSNNNQPKTLKSDGINGYDSTSNQRAYGTLTDPNPQTRCDGAFGDTKALDTWTSFPSANDATTLDVAALPAGPVAGNDTGSTTANTELKVEATDPNGLLQNDNGSAVTVTSHTDPANGSVTTTAAGAWDYTPKTDFSGTDTFTYTITDDAGQTATAKVTLTVTPTAGNDTLTTTRNAAGTVTVLGNDHGSSLTVSPGTTAPAHGSIVVNNDNTITYTPATNYTGTDTFSYTVTDSSGQTSTATVNVRVDPAPADPVATNDTEGTPYQTPVTLAGATNDRTGDATRTLDISKTVFTANGGKSLTTTEGTWAIQADGSVRFTPAARYVGTTDPVTYEITDSTGVTATATLTATVQSGPVGTPDTPTTKQNVTQTVNPLANDTPGPNGDGTKGSFDPTTLVFPTTGQPANAEVSTDGKMLTLPGVGVYTIGTGGAVTFDPDPTLTGTTKPVAYTAKDSHGNPVSATIAFTVTALTPTATDDAGATPAGVPVTLKGATNDTPGDASAPIVASSVVFPSTGQPSGWSVSSDGKTISSPMVGSFVVNPAGTITFTPTAGASGPVPAVTYQVADTNGTTDTATLSVTVRAGASASPDFPSTTQNVNGTVDPLGNDTAGKNADGSDGTLDKTSVQLTKTGLPLGSTLENGGKKLTVPGQGVYTVDPTTGVVTFDPEPGFSGTASPVTYTAQDTVTAADGTAAHQPLSSTFTFSVGAITPTATDDSAVTLAGVPVTLPGATNDKPGAASVPIVPASTVFPTSGQPSEAQISNGDKTLTLPGKGTFTLDSDGAATFTPAAGFAGVVPPATYQITDQNGTKATATLSVTVRPGPTASPDAASTDQNVNATLDPLANDTAGQNADGTSGTLDHTSVQLTTTGLPAGSAVANGGKTLTVPGQGVYTVDPTTGVVTFDPEPGFTGTTSPVTYTAQDSVTATDGSTVRQPLTSTFTFAVGVLPPVATNDTATAPYGMPVQIRVLANDGPGASAAPLIAAKTVFTAGGQPNGAQLSADGKTLTVPGAGTFTVAADGVVTFTPVGGFTGAVPVVTYQITDAYGATASATIAVTVGAAGVARPDAASTKPNTPVTISVLSNDGAPSGEPWVPSSVCLSVRGKCVKSHTQDGIGTWTVNPDGTITFEPAKGYHGTTQVKYSVLDGAGHPYTATVTVKVKDAAGTGTTAGTSGSGAAPAAAPAGDALPDTGGPARGLLVGGGLAVLAGLLLIVLGRRPRRPAGRRRAPRPLPWSATTGRH